MDELAAISIDEMALPLASTKLNLLSSIEKIKLFEVSNELVIVAVKWAVVFEPVKSPLVLPIISLVTKCSCLMEFWPTLGF